MSRWAGGDDNASATVIKLDEPETYRKTAALIVDCNTEVLHIPTLQEHLSDGARTRKYSVKDQTSKNRPRIKDNRKRQLEREEVIFVEDDAAASDVSARAKLGLVQRPEQLELEPES